MFDFYTDCILIAIGGALGACAVSLFLPGLHIYNIMGFVILFYLPFIDVIDPFLMLMLLTGMITGFGMLFTISTIYYSAPDDTTSFYFMPSQKLLMEGRGHEATMLTGIGALAGLFLLVLVLPVTMGLMQMLRELLGPHYHWMIGSIIAFLIISEWPREYGRSSFHLFNIPFDLKRALDSGNIPEELRARLIAKGKKITASATISKPRSHEWEIRDGRTVYIVHEKLAKAGDQDELMVLIRMTKFQRLKEAYKSIAAGLLTWALAGWLGMIVFHKTLLSPDMAFQSLMPVFVGLFAVSSIILAFISKVKVPRQHIAKSYDVSTTQVLSGSGAGFLGGLFSAFAPAVTPGVGGVLSGNATGQRDDKIFILSMGTNRVVYYVGAISLFLLPLLHLRSGGMAINVNLFFIPQTYEQFMLVTAAIAITGFISFLFLLYSSKFIARIISKVQYQVLNAIALAVVVAIVLIMCGPMGLAVMFISAMIGIVPIMWNSRRLNLLGVLLIPIWLNMAGLGPAIASLMGLG